MTIGNNPISSLANCFGFMAITDLVGSVGVGAAEAKQSMPGTPVSKRAVGANSSWYLFVSHGKGRIYIDQDEHGENHVVNIRADNGEIDEVKVTAPETEGRFTVLDALWHPAYKNPAYYHDFHAETFFVLDGQVKATIGEEST